MQDQKHRLDLAREDAWTSGVDVEGTMYDPVLCEAVWLLDMRAALPAPAAGSLLRAIEAARDACAAGASARGVSV